MPRSKAARDFGFRAEGLVRILTAAEPEEVLIAFEELGIQQLKVEGLFDQFLNVARELFGPLDLFLSGLQVAGENFRLVISAAEADLAPGRGGAGAIVVENKSDADALKLFFAMLDNDTKKLQSQQAKNERDLTELAKQTEDDLAITFL